MYAVNEYEANTDFDWFSDEEEHETGASTKQPYCEVGQQSDIDRTKQLAESLPVIPPSPEAQQSYHLCYGQLELSAAPQHY